MIHDAPRARQAYLSISLDATGLLRFLAFWVAKKGGASGRKLHFYLYLFFLTSAAVVGNVSCRMCTIKGCHSKLPSAKGSSNLVWHDIPSLPD